MWPEKPVGWLMPNPPLHGLVKSQDQLVNLNLVHWIISIYSDAVSLLPYSKAVFPHSCLGYRRADLWF